jgi:hypothetical protein
MDLQRARPAHLYGVRGAVAGREQAGWYSKEPIMLIHALQNAVFLGVYKAVIAAVFTVYAIEWAGFLLREVVLWVKERRS